MKVELGEVRHNKRLQLFVASGLQNAMYTVFLFANEKPICSTPHF